MWARQRPGVGGAALVKTGESSAARGIVSEARMAPPGQAVWTGGAIILPAGIFGFLCTTREVSMSTVTPL